LLAAACAACSGSGGTANTTPRVAPSASASPTGTPVPSGSPNATPSPTPSPARTAAPTATPSPTPTPAPSASASPAAYLFSEGCQIGSNYLDFESASKTYVPAPGYGQLTVGTNLGQFANLGITPGETGQIQSLDEGTGNVTLPSPFITFNGGGSQNTLIATDIPPGQTGPFTFVDNPNGTSTASFEVDGSIDMSNGASGNAFRLFFSATFPVPAAVVLATLPQDSTCIATSGDVEPTSLRRGGR
jgi:hypothetical protein